jgi:5-oxoprolinase (ATP-hydrolysing)
VIDSALDLELLRKDLEDLKSTGIQSLAVVLMHSYAVPAHELLVGALAKEMGFTQISLSH